MELSRQYPFYGIGFPKRFLEVFGGHFFKTHLRGPCILRSEVPFGQRQVCFDRRFHLAMAGRSMNQDELAGRVG